MSDSISHSASPEFLRQLRRSSMYVYTFPRLVAAAAIQPNPRKQNTI
jgi:hypothetical protein